MLRRLLIRAIRTSSTQQEGDTIAKTKLRATEGAPDALCALFHKTTLNAHLTGDTLHVNRSDGFLRLTWRWGWLYG